MIKLPTKYEFCKEYSFEEISMFEEHRRMKHYIKKGNYCYKCGIVCDRLIHGYDNHKNLHIDLYVGEDNIETNLTQDAKNTIRKLKIGDIAVLSGLDFSNPHEGLEVHVRKEKQSAFEISSVGY